MRLYLSSYNFGNQSEKLIELLRDQKPRVAIVTNAADAGDEERIVERFNDQAEFFRKYNLEADRLDLRNYFGKEAELHKKCSEYGLFWVRGGNVFVLRQAMKQSGFDLWLTDALAKDSIVYGGYSAGGCVLSPSLEGYDIVDDTAMTKVAYGLEADYSALGIINYAFEPHYKSDHPESADIDKEIEKLEKLGIPYRTLRDGEALLIDGNKEEFLK